MAKKRNKTTFGTLALSMFWLVIVSGILLAIPFKIQDPYLSISGIILGNPWASTIRNAHYWSSQFFLIFTLIHLYDHFHFRKKIGMKPGMAIRLGAGVLIILMAMLSGFLLKADADSIQARQILNSLIQSIPLIGKSLAYSFLGDDKSFLLIYVHHIATLTIFIAIIMVEHSRKFWPKLSEFTLTTAGIVLMSIFLNAPLHDNFTQTVKGPWYFVGFQELLHWLNHPGWSLLIVLGILAGVSIVNTAKSKITWPIKRGFLLFTAFYLFLTVVGLFFRGEAWRFAYPGQEDYSESVLHNFKTSSVNFYPEYKLEEVFQSSEIFGRKESCLLCHTDTYGFADSHNPEVIGCFSCHGGNPLAGNKGEAHRGMIKIPGNLSNANRSCGTVQCHPEITERVPTSLMATLSGMISVNRTAFGEQSDPDILTHVNSIKNTAADTHLKNLCAGCHLGNPKTEYGPAKDTEHGGGCLVCHLNYSKQAENALAHSRSGYIKAHPALNLKVTNNHCFSCHSKSGRISTNYEGWHETNLLPDQMPDSAQYRLIQGHRVFRKVQEDIHHELGMECIDCHGSYELMGDGKTYAHQEDQEEIACADCHSVDKSKLIESKKLDNESAIIASLRFEEWNDKKFLSTQKSGRAIINTYFSNDSAFLVSKNEGKIYFIKPLSNTCSNTKAHSNLACSSCHSSWAPSCISCHTDFNPEAKGFNMLGDKRLDGAWVEHTGKYAAKLPAMGVRTTKNGSEIIPVIPGMIMTLDKSGFPNHENDSLLFRRWYAPAAPHTSTSKVRNCKSCHSNSYALGLGEGSLDYKVHNSEAKWRFNPSNEVLAFDSLPQDAWTGFLKTRQGMASGRKNVAPFNAELQKKVLLVGACLNCHSEDSEIMKRSLNNFDALLKQVSRHCILPTW